MNAWLDDLNGLIEFLRTSPTSPITFLIGAGTSLSSGGPTTAEVQTALEAVNGGRLGDAELTTVEKTTVGRLFHDFEPYLGYHALAAMALTRPVFVLNLNWDDGVERAALAVGAPHITSISIHEERRLARLRGRLARVNQHPGLVCIHLHGMLADGNYQFSKLETLTFREPARSLILELLSNTTVIIGASLRGDYDITSILRDAAKEGKAGPVWFVSREERSFKSDYALYGMLSARGEKKVVQDATVDFDRLLLHVHTASGELTYDKFIADHYPKAPKYADLVFPRPELIRPLLKFHAIAVVEDPKIGKTPIGHLLAFFFMTCHRPGAEQKVMMAQDVWSCTSFLNNHEGILYLDRPFGKTEFRSNPQFFRVLATKLRKAKRTRVIIECTPTAWKKALEEHGDDVSGFVASTPLDVRWFHREDLLALFEASEFPAIAQAIADDVLKTPGQVILALKTGIALPPQAPEAIAERKQHLMSLGEHGKVVALVRLQHLATASRPWRNLLLDAGFRDEREVLYGCCRWIETFPIDEHQFARLINFSDAEIIDDLLDEPGNALLTAVRQVGAQNEWIIDALRVRDAVKAVRNRDADVLRTFREEERRDLAPTLLQVAGNDWPLRFIDHASMDLCLLRDLAFEIVRLWPNLSRSPDADRIFKELLKTELREGLYALIEAALFLKDATEPEIWERFHDPLWDLLKGMKYDRPMSEERLRMVAMIFDGILWRDKPNDDFARLWFPRFFDAVSVTSPLAGAFAFSLVYHGQAAARYLRESVKGQQQRLERLNRLADNIAQADEFCWMMRWHFERECRDRAIMLRRDQLSKKFLKYIGRTNDGDVAPEEEIPILLAALRALKRPEHAGWAFHLALNMETVNGKYGKAVETELAELLDIARDADSGVVLAAMNYPAECVLAQLQEYFRRPINRNALLNAFAQGIQCNVEIDAPKFDYTRDPFMIMSTLDIRWPALEQLGAEMEREEFLRWINDLAAQAHISSQATGEVRRLLKLAARGDLRLFEDTAQRLLVSTPAEVAREQLIASIVGVPAVEGGERADHAQEQKDEHLRSSAQLQVRSKRYDPTEWLHRLDEVVGGAPTVDVAPFLDGFISAAGDLPVLERRLADAYRERARLRVLRGSVEADEYASVKRDFREALRLYLRDFVSAEAAKTESELRRTIWSNGLKPGQKRPSSAMQERIDKHPIDVLEQTILNHAKLSTRASVMLESRPGTRFKNFAPSSDAAWAEALREATKERTLF